jgi:hypothetical protein
MAIIKAEGRRLDESPKWSYFELFVSKSERVRVTPECDPVYLEPTTARLVALAQKTTRTPARRRAPTTSELGMALVDVRSYVGFDGSDEDLGGAFLQAMEAQPPDLRRRVRFALGLSSGVDEDAPGVPTESYGARSRKLHGNGGSDVTTPRNYFLFAQVLVDLVGNLSSGKPNETHRGFWLQSVHIELHGQSIDPRRGGPNSLIVDAFDDFPLVYRTAARVKRLKQRVDLLTPAWNLPDVFEITMTLICNQSHARAISIPLFSGHTQVKVFRVTASERVLSISSRSDVKLLTAPTERPELVVPLVDSPRVGELVTVHTYTERPSYTMDEHVQWRSTDMRERVRLEVTRQYGNGLGSDDEPPRGAVARVTPVAGPSTRVAVEPVLQEHSYWKWSYEVSASEPGAVYAIFAK